MAGAVFYVMAILGCGDGESQCQAVRFADTPYVSAAACNAAGPDLLMRNSDLAFPVLMTECRPSGQAMVAVETRPAG